MAEPLAELLIYFGAGVIIISGTFGIWIYLQWRPGSLVVARPRPTAVAARQRLSPPIVERAPRPASALTTVELVASVAALLVVFVLIDGPIWLHPFDLERAAWLSYLPIPLMVLGLLGWRHKLQLASWLLGVLQLTLAKFGVTLLLMVGLWALSPPPDHRHGSPATARGDSEAEADPEPPEPTPWPDDQRFEVAGHAVDRDGKPLAGAVVYVSAGLETITFETPKEPLYIELAGGHIHPAVVVARTYQPLRARSTDGRMHNLVAAPGATALFNVPLLASGNVQRIRARRSDAFVPLACMVHGGVEQAQLLLLSHPFYTVTGDDGSFRWKAVPELRLSIRGYHPTGGGAEITLEPSQPSQSLELRLR